MLNRIRYIKQQILFNDYRPDHVFPQNPLTFACDSSRYAFKPLTKRNSPPSIQNREREKKCRRNKCSRKFSHTKATLLLTTCNLFIIYIDECRLFVHRNENNGTLQLVTLHPVATVRFSSLFE